MMEHDVAYFHRRASEESAAADHASHPNARQAHLELADRYRDMATAIAARDPSHQAESDDHPESVRLSA